MIITKVTNPENRETGYSIISNITVFGAHPFANQGANPTTAHCQWLEMLDEMLDEQLLE